MINQYGADSVRWFILSDSPPEKDVQWASTGVEAANKFLQKIFNLNQLVINRKDAKPDTKKEDTLIKEINNFIIKIDDSINNFKFNVSIAYFYQLYNFFKNSINEEISNKILKDCLVKIMKLMLPITPHLSHECLSLLNCNDFSKWPKIDKANVKEEIKLAVQINGKTRDILQIKKDLNVEEIKDLILKISKAKKYIENRMIKKTIFVKNKIINYLIESK